MKRKLLVGSLIAAVALPLAAIAEEVDCFPMCLEPVKVEMAVEKKADAKLETVNVMTTRESVAETATTTPCEPGFIRKAEELNDKIKPIREIVSYVRSPQGLAIKLVNDHIVKIPAWVGYAMDPIGSIKHRAINEVRTQVKSALDDGKACAEPASALPFRRLISMPGIRPDSLTSTGPEMKTHHAVSKIIHTTVQACIVAAILTFNISAHANSTTDASRASINASIAIPVTLVAGTTQFFKDAGQLSVTGVRTIGNVSVITLRGLANGAEASVQVSSKAIEGSAIAAGVVLQATVSATGVLLVSAGKALMFVPNEVGMGLLHHSRARDY